MGWRRHFQRLPAGDYHSQMILAQLTAGVLSFLDDKRAYALHDVAPWLEPPDVRSAREEREQQDRRNALMDLAFEDWKRSRGEG